MQIDKWLKTATSLLSASYISTARLDALVLMEDVLGNDRSWLLAHGEDEVSDENVATLKKLLSRRAQHEPLAYVRGKTEFYGRTFLITPAVLEPRPESETMIDLLKKLHKNSLQGISELFIGDVGTGSGALGITAALELPGSHIELLEVDTEALEVAKSNVDLFTSEITTVQSNLLSKSAQDNHVLLCNLPYVPDDYQINLAASHEPALAIFGGPDGLDLYRKLFEQLKMVDKKPLYILCESLPVQHNALEVIASEGGYILQETDDFIQLFALEK